MKLLCKHCAVCGTATNHDWVKSDDGFAPVIDYYGQFQVGAAIGEPSFEETLASNGAICSWDCFHSFAGKGEDE